MADQAEDMSWLNSSEDKTNGNGAFGDSHDDGDEEETPFNSMSFDDADADSDYAPSESSETDDDYEEDVDDDDGNDEEFTPQDEVDSQLWADEKEKLKWTLSFERTNLKWQRKYGCRIDSEARPEVSEKLQRERRWRRFQQGFVIIVAIIYAIQWWAVWNEYNFDRMLAPLQSLWQNNPVPPPQDTTHQETQVDNSAGEVHVQIEEVPAGNAVDEEVPEGTNFGELHEEIVAETEPEETIDDSFHDVISEHEEIGEDLEEEPADAFPELSRDDEAVLESTDEVDEEISVHTLPIDEPLPDGEDTTVDSVAPEVPSEDEQAEEVENPESIEDEVNFGEFNDETIVSDDDRSSTDISYDESAPETVPADESEQGTSDLEEEAATDLNPNATPDFEELAEPHIQENENSNDELVEEPEEIFGSSEDDDTEAVHEDAATEDLIPEIEELVTESNDNVESIEPELAFEGEVEESTTDIDSTLPLDDGIDDQNDVDEWRDQAATDSEIESDSVVEVAVEPTGDLLPHDANAASVDNHVLVDDTTTSEATNTQEDSTNSEVADTQEDSVHDHAAQVLQVVEARIQHCAERVWIVVRDKYQSDATTQAFAACDDAVVASMDAPFATLAHRALAWRGDLKNFVRDFAGAAKDYESSLAATFDTSVELKRRSATWMDWYARGELDMLAADCRSAIANGDTSPALSVVASQWLQVVRVQNDTEKLKQRLFQVFVETRKLTMTPLMATASV
ncbi:hypothetical protein AeNC1_003620 [Aphanomyces euteiches]|nr:hypothetical protein AeNC1_003620 [Aphanomyces euteiches]